jgi:hypothetical protein
MTSAFTVMSALVNSAEVNRRLEYRPVTLDVDRATSWLTAFT